MVHLVLGHLDGWTSKFEYIAYNATFSWKIEWISAALGGMWSESQTRHSWLKNLKHNIVSGLLELPKPE